jgi:hypothetical protein
MAREIVERREDRASLRFDDRHVGVRSGKAFDGLDRIPERESQEFHLAFGFPSKQISAFVPGEVLKVRSHPRREMSTIGVSL